MKYFTPELFLEINSADDVVADAAMGRWEKAVQDYRRHLSALVTEVPGGLQRLAGLSLHDWELVKLDMEGSDFAGGCDAGFWLVLRNGKERLILFYLLWDKIKRSDAPAACRFSKKRVHWLYDELDSMANRRGRFVHRILLSNGEMLSIPFSGVFVEPMKVDEAFSQDELAALFRLAPPFRPPVPGRLSSSDRTDSRSSVAAVRRG